MAWHIAKRLGAALVVMVVVSLLTFLVTRVLFPDPVQSILGGQGSSATPEQLHRLTHELGLDKPLFVQYFDWIGGTLHGDLGRSFRTPVGVGGAIWDRLPVTIELMVLSLLVALVLGTLLGVLAALFRGRWVDTVASALSVLALSLPNFFLGILLVYWFALKFRLLPSSGYVPFLDDPLGNLKLMILPALTLSMAYVGTFARYVRTLMLGVLSEDYVLRAHASGLEPRRVVVRHAMKNTAIPMVTVVGLNAAGLVGGAVVTESVFSLPGLGTLLTTSILGKDFPMLQGLILVITIGVVVLNLLIDLVYGALDPRIKVS
ncbi:ABC transporter permease [Streptomyces sp. NPDC050560]|uniref:ABC transporter permease n=1 Tax=Streptomyces sp. NPDC050560 TaxID=3365630 RepID=UPI0037877B76